MRQKYYGDVRVRAQGGSLVITIPAEAVNDLDIDEEDHIPIHGDGDMLALVPPTEPRGETDGTELR